jgi:hypothetical protein
MTWSENDVKRAYTDFTVFLYIVWKEIGLPPPTPIQMDMARAIQYPPNDRFIIEGFRGVAKSFITCAYIVWRLWKDPNLKCEIISASRDRADANAIFIKKILYALEFLAHLKPGPEQRDTQNIFDVAGCEPDISPSVKSVGITGQITGTRADILVADDVEVPNNSGTQVQRDKLFEAVKEFDAILKPGGQILYLGTPQNEMSLYNELQNRGYRVMMWPVVYPEDPKEREFYGDKLAPIIANAYDKDPEGMAGQPTDPLRFNAEEIAKRRLSYGRSGFALQFKLNTNLSDYEKFPLKVADLVVMDLDLERGSLLYNWASDNRYQVAELPCVGLKGDIYYGPMSRSEDTQPYTGTVMSIDPAGRGKDETAYAIVKYLNGYLFLFEIGGLQDGYSDVTLQYLANKCKFYGVNQVVVEANFGDGMFTQLLKPVLNKTHPCSIEEVKHTKQKELRIIDTLEPVMMRHKLIVAKTVIEDDYKVYQRDPQRSLVYQMTRLSKDRGALAHDDRLDALTMAVAHWLESMDRDAQVGLDELMEEELEKWMDPDRGIFNTEPLSFMQNQNLNMLHTFMK